MSDRSSATRRAAEATPSLDIDDGGALTAGVRELRDHLSRYLDEVKAGRSVTGRPARGPGRVRTYVDPSAMVRLLLAEADSATAGRLWAQATEPLVSIVGSAELRGSVARAARGGRIADDDYPTARLEQERMWGTLAAIRLLPEVA